MDDDNDDDDDDDDVNDDDDDDDIQLNWDWSFHSLIIFTSKTWTSITWLLYITVNGTSEWPKVFLIFAWQSMVLQFS
jgi:hypothetical protein